jgi:protein-disulfide isomerase
VAVRTGGATGRRGRWAVLALLVLGGVALLVAVVELSTQEGGPPKVELGGVNEAQRIFGGLRQDGDRLGDPDAPVSIQVFNDVQCDNCAEQFLATVPPLVDELVRSDRAQLLYRHYGFGPNPVELGFVAAEAAAEQGYGWQYVYLFFANQAEAERVGIGTDFLEAIAASIGDLDLEEWSVDFERGREPGSAITEKLVRRDEVARDLGLRAAPSAIVTGPKGTDVLQDFPGLEEIRAAVERVS